MAISERLRNRAVDPRDRLALIAGPFYAGCPLIRQPAGEPHIDRRSGALLAATVVVPLLIVCSGLPTHVPAVVAAGGLAVASIASLATDVSRYVRRTVRPRLVRALTPFDATLDELETLAATDQVVANIAKRVNLRELHRDLSSVDGTPGDDGPG